MLLAVSCVSDRNLGVPYYTFIVYIYSRLEIIVTKTLWKLLRPLYSLKEHSVLGSNSFCKGSRLKHFNQSASIRREFRQPAVYNTLRVQSTQ